MSRIPYPRSAFRVLVDLQKLSTNTVDGTVVNSWESLACVRASLVPRASFTIKQADRVHEAATHLVVIDYRPEVRGASRIVAGDGRVFEIKGIPRRDQEPNPRYLEIDGIEVE